MGDPPADSQRSSSPRRQAGMKSSRVDSRNPSEGNAAGKLDYQGRRSDLSSRGASSLKTPSNTLPLGAGLIGAIARSVTGSDGPGSRSQNARSGESGWESTPSLREIANQLIADKIARLHPALERASQQPSDVLLHEHGLGHSTLALLMGERSLANQDAPNEPDTHSLVPDPVGNGPASAADPFGLGLRGSGANGASSSVAGQPVEHERQGPSGRSGRADSPDLATNQTRLEGGGSRFEETTGLAAQSVSAHIDTISDSRTARPALMPGEAISPTTGTKDDPIRSQDSSRVEARSGQPGNEPDRFVSHLGAGRLGIPTGFDRAAVDLPDYRSIPGFGSGGLPAGGESKSADDSTLAGRTGSGESQLNLTKTNELLQQILEELKKEKRSYLPMTDRNDNKTFES